MLLRLLNEYNHIRFFYHTLDFLFTEIKNLHYSQNISHFHIKILENLIRNLEILEKTKFLTKIQLKLLQQFFNNILIDLRD